MERGQPLEARNGKRKKIVPDGLQKEHSPADTLILPILNF